MAAPSRSGDPACGRPSVPSGDSRFTYFTSKQRFVTTRSSHLAWAILVSAWIVRANHCWEPTSLRADDGRVHGRCFRRRVASTSAKEWAQVFDNPSRPYQFAFGARAGTDAFAASARAALSLRPTAVVVSVDGRCAYASMSHIAFPSTLPVREVAPEIARAVVEPAFASASAPGRLPSAVGEIHTNLARGAEPSPERTGTVPGSKNQAATAALGDDDEETTTTTTTTTHLVSRKTRLRASLKCRPLTE
ncbi:unnamed protein product, partial [Symbiodinium sp. KB8]